MNMPDGELFLSIKAKDLCRYILTNTNINANATINSTRLQRLVSDILVLIHKAAAMDTGSDNPVAEASKKLELQYKILTDFKLLQYLIIVYYRDGGFSFSQFKYIKKQIIACQALVLTLIHKDKIKF